MTAALTVATIAVALVWVAAMWLLRDDKPRHIVCRCCHEKEHGDVRED